MYRLVDNLRQAHSEIWEASLRAATRERRLELQDEMELCSKMLTDAKEFHANIFIRKMKDGILTHEYTPIHEEVAEYLRQKLNTAGLVVENPYDLNAVYDAALNTLDYLEGFYADMLKGVV